MRRLLLVILWALVFCSNNCIAAEQARGKVVSVTNGNLLSVQDETGEIRQVRLYGIDAPDSEQKMGPQAGKMLAAMVHEKDVEVKVEGVDSNGIPNVSILLNGLSVNAAMAKSGYAWVNPETCKSSDCSAWSGYQQYASQNKKGLWVDPEAEPPWKWRERRAKAKAKAKSLAEENQYRTYDQPSVSSESASTSRSVSSYSPEKTQQVRSYTRKDGTVVQAYKRRPPR